MSFKASVVIVAAAASSIVLGYGEQEVVGAWALASRPDRTCLVVTNKTAWILQDGCWRPSLPVSEDNHGIHFNLVGDMSSSRNIFWTPTKDWERRVLAESGTSVREGDLVWAIEGQRNNKIVFCNASRMVRSEMPDWAKIRDEKRYVGFWKPVRRQATFGRNGNPDTVGNVLLKIREDMFSILCDCDHKPTKDSPEPYKILPLLPTEGGLRVDYRDRYAGDDDPLNCMVRGLWLDPSGQLVCYWSDEIVTFVRTNDSFDDPIDARRKMAATKAFHGVWGVNVEFKIMILGFDRSGRGYMSGFMSLVPFRWSVMTNGVIHCVLDAEMVWTGRSASPVSLDCRYDPVKNEMEVEIPPNEDEGEIASTRKTLPFMTWKIRSDEIFARIDAAKKSPQWRRELERRRNRPPETQEEKERRLRRATEKRRARENAAKEQAAREEEEARKQKWFRDVLDHYDQVVRNEAYYSETNGCPACYLQDNLFRGMLGSAEDNHVVVEHIQANPKLLPRYYNIAGHDNLLQEDIDWLFKNFLSDYLQNKNPRYMELLMSSQYKKLSMAQYEEAFRKLPDNDYIKMRIHANAHYRDRRFHPEWRSSWRRQPKRQ